MSTMGWNLAEVADRARPVPVGRGASAGTVTKTRAGIWNGCNKAGLEVGRGSLAESRLELSRSRVDAAERRWRHRLVHNDTPVLGQWRATREYHHHQANAQRSLSRSAKRIRTRSDCLRRGASAENLKQPCDPVVGRCDPWTDCAVAGHSPQSKDMPRLSRAYSGVAGAADIRPNAAAGIETPYGFSLLPPAAWSRHAATGCLPVCYQVGYLDGPQTGPGAFHSASRPVHGIGENCFPVASSDGRPARLEQIRNYAFDKTYS